MDAILMETSQGLLLQGMYLLELSRYTVPKVKLPVVLLSGFVSFSRNKFPVLFQDSRVIFPGFQTPKPISLIRQY